MYWNYFSMLQLSRKGDTKNTSLIAQLRQKINMVCKLKKTNWTRVESIHVYVLFDRVLRISIVISKLTASKQEELGYMYM